MLAQYFSGKCTFLLKNGKKEEPQNYVYSDLEDIKYLLYCFFFQNRGDPPITRRVAAGT